MNTISNVARYRACLDEDGIVCHREKEDGRWVKYEDYEQIEKELLALRKERERAEPVHDQDMCDHEVFEKGVSACLVDIPKGAAEIICRGISAATGYMIDWHYVGGRVHIKALRTAPPAPPVADDSLPYDPQIAEYEQMMEAEQAQADTTSQQFESLESVKQPSSNLAATGKASRDLDDNSSPDSQTTIKQFDGWIPCSERMPETYVNVLLTDEHGDTCIGQLESFEDAHFYISSSIHRYKATHWQPLPEPPCK
ncbi:DUF551 domain-containing protein [Cronobacter dublinensis]